MTIISPVADILAEIRAGRMVILVDEEDRENEGDLVLAADFVTAEAVNFMATHGRGLICLTLTGQHCRQLDLPLMVSANRSPLGTNFTLSIEAAQGVTTGISAADRACTIRAASRPDARPEDIIQPGHIFPLMSQDGGVLVRAGHTEAGCDLARLAGLTPAAVICEILKKDGEMARLPDLIGFAAEHQIKIGTIADLIHYRSRTESLVEKVAERPIQTIHGEFRLLAYLDKTAGVPHLVFVKGDIRPDRETLVRVHEPLSVIDLLDVADDTHSWKINDAFRVIAESGCGVIVLLQRKQDPAEWLQRVASTRSGSRPQESQDLRDYGIGAQILRDLDVGKMRVLGTPRKMPSMAGFDLEVTGYREPENSKSAASRDNRP